MPAVSQDIVFELMTVVNVLMIGKGVSPTLDVSSEPSELGQFVLTALLELSATALFSFELTFGVSTNSGQKIPVKRTIIKMHEIRSIFVLTVPFSILLSGRRWTLASSACNLPKSHGNRPIHKSIPLIRYCKQIYLRLVKQCSSRT
jgi:hypothetical protein